MFGDMFGCQMPSWGSYDLRHVPIEAEYWHFFQKISKIPKNRLSAGVHPRYIGDQKAAKIF